jgi:hypothetical protein
MANKEIYVKIQKVSSGVQFTILNARTRNPVARKMSEKDRRDLFTAYSWYCEEVRIVGAAHGVYFDSMREIGEYSTQRDNCIGFVNLEPWGFADGTFDAPVMADSGSTPTNARAKRLLCYQAPLNRVDTLVNIQFERVITIGEEPGMFAASSQSV